ncbi:MAG: MoxR family ATPase [Blastocatellia bacterium]|nr:MoxR family ATPase [Blastocatellia bacterium]MBL8196221.1 MoxR family ATPase [Blastocatellia bacterium]MBN8725149.1 MoxR family ATPase [Acidobacteriota bacterium]
MDLSTAITKTKQLQKTIETVIRGKSEVIRLAIIALLAGGHLLIEDVPGVGKTTLAQTMARSFNCTFNRVQFTSDLLPSDIVGLSVYNQRADNFEFRPGPIFANVILADEINRTTPKTQSSLLEAMAEGHVTIENKTYPLPRPFIVLATQNPVEHHGTYPLPESQLDRFMMRISMGYPEMSEEKQILRNQMTRHPIESIEPIMQASDVVELQKLVREVRVDDLILDYLVKLVDATRNNELLELGVSPRASLALLHAAQSCAILEKRDYCIPDDVKNLLVPVFSHRVIVNARYGSAKKHSEEAESVLQEILKTVEVPI